MNNKQSSIERLAKLIKFTNKEVYAELFEEIEHIKAMHKEEMINSILDNRNITSRVTFKDAEQYYNETFEGGNK
jgi:hypothetical protein